MTDWQLQPPQRRCTVSGETLIEGDRVACFLIQGASGDLTRADVRAAHEETFRPEGVILGRWSRVIPSRQDEARAARRDALANHEELFRSLFSGPALPPGQITDTVTEPGPQNASQFSEVRDALQQVLALLLERQRLLKEVDRVGESTVRYRHTKTGEFYDVPMGVIPPAILVSLKSQLADLLPL